MAVAVLALDRPGARQVPVVQAGARLRARPGLGEGARRAAAQGARAARTCRRRGLPLRRRVRQDAAGRRSRLPGTAAAPASDDGGRFGTILVRLRNIRHDAEAATIDNALVQNRLQNCNNARTHSDSQSNVIQCSDKS